MRMSRRFGAYTKFVKQGYNSDMARQMSDELYPPTKEDLKYERSRKNPKPSFPIFSLLSLLYPNIATYYFTKFNVTLLESNSSKEFILLTGICLQLLSCLNT